MLYLDRRIGEWVIIGTPPNEIRLLVVSIDHGKVRLGTEAPRSVPVFRSELLEKKDGE